MRDPELTIITYCGYSVDQIKYAKREFQMSLAQKILIRNLLP